jgi:histidine triad (HIT) family protein
MDCVFCAIVARKIPSTVVYENEKTLAFMDISPANNGHTLVIPKAHFRNLFDIDEATLLEVMKASFKVAQAVKKALQPDGMTLLQSNEKGASQTVFHYHLHLIPRWLGDGLPLPLRPTEGKISEIEEVAGKIRAEL